MAEHHYGGCYLGWQHSRDSREQAKEEEQSKQACNNNGLLVDDRCGQERLGIEFENTMKEEQNA